MRQTGEDPIIRKSDIVAPKGWEAADVTTETAKQDEQQHLQLLKKRIGLHLPFISNGVEDYIKMLRNTFNIVVSAAYISVNNDTTFHINLLINQEDYLSPKLMAAKIKAAGFLNTIGNVSVQFRFTVAEEYFRSHYAQRSFELNYAFRKAYEA